MNQHTAVNGYKSNIWSGVTTLELAEFIYWVIHNDITGLFHLTNNDSISKYDLLKLIAAIYKKNIIISADKDYVSDKSFINTNTQVSYKVKTFNEMIVRQLEFMNAHPTYYQHYKK
jgi:dTDP-4-dehydrorhamnose reductase